MNQDKRLAIEKVSEIISKAKSVLASTDWVQLELNKVNVFGGWTEIREVREKYKKELAERENARLVLEKQYQLKEEKEKENKNILKEKIKSFKTEFKEIKDLKELTKKLEDFSFTIEQYLEIN